MVKKNNLYGYFIKVIFKCFGDKASLFIKYKD